MMELQLEWDETVACQALFHHLNIFKFYADNLKGSNHENIVLGVFEGDDKNKLTTEKKMF